MSFEIYYTSAPEGIKRGTSGFCTVAATENIPKPLWDRLETLSAYRHQFGVNAGDGATGGGVEQNPVSHAHWILSVTGKTYHVLSRICDSGVDHTQRTNAFAHHLVVEGSEMEAAPGGPAWMLEQSGVMAREWDGRVGPLSHGGLPRGDGGGARVCRRWAEVTGDGGWGGHLADLFVKSPGRPVCILFAPGQELLPLVGEALALLPAAARWNVTFNTYFTSMPTSATCLWRCCLAGTPAAQVGLRYAANGLVLDLTDPKRLPALPGGGGAGPYLTMARTGQAAAPLKVSVPATPATPAKAKATKQAKAQAVKESGVAGKPSPIVEEDDDDDEIEQQRNAFFESISEGGTKAAEGSAGGGGGVGGERTYDLAPEATLPQPAVTVERALAPKLAKVRKRTIREADAALAAAETEAEVAAGQRRKQFMWLFGGALLAIVGGTGAVWWAYHKMAPPEEPSKGMGSINRDREMEVRPAEPGIEEKEATVTQPPEIAPSATRQAAVPGPSTARSVGVPIPAQAPPVIPLYPRVIQLADVIEKPSIGNGIGDRTQSMGLKPGDLDRVAVRGLRIHFPVAGVGTGEGRAARADSVPDDVYTSDTLGIFTGKSEVRAGRPGVAILWKEAADPGFASEVMYITYDRLRPGLELQWHSAPLLKNASLLSSCYWVLEGSALELQSVREHGQQVTFKPFVPATAGLTDTEFTIAWLAEPPKGTLPTPPRMVLLPHGWETSSFTDWEEKNAAMRSPNNASQVIRFRRPFGAVEAGFMVTFRPGLAKVENNFAKRVAEDKADLAKFEGDLRAAEQLLTSAKSTSGGAESQGLRDAQTKRDALASLVEAYKNAVASYDELTDFEIGIDLPDGLRLATLKFQKKASNSGK